MPIKIIFLFVLVISCLRADNNATIEDLNATVNDLNVTVKLLNEKVQKLKESSKDYKKMLRPNKDIDFIWKSIGGYSDFKATMAVAHCLGFKEDNVTKINHPGLAGDVKITGQTHIIDYDNYGYLRIVPIDEDKNSAFLNIDSQENNSVSLCQLKYAESSMHIVPDKNATLKTRISTVYSALNNDEWDKDNIRFGMLTQYLYEDRVLAASASINFYPSYRRHTPGDPDLLRRLSFFVAFGTPLSQKTDTAITSVYSVGLGVDIIKGVNFAAGLNYYTRLKVGETESESINSFGVGITLTSDLWSDLISR